MRTGRIIVVTGAQAAGKTTVGAALAALLPRSLHVDADEIQRMVVSGRARYDVPPSPAAEEQLRLRHDGALRLAELYADHGFDAVISDNLFGEHLLRLVRSALSRRPDVYVVVLDLDPDVLRAREDARAKSGYTATVTPELLVRAVREETPRIGLWHDSAGETVDQTARLLLERLPEGRITGI